MSGCLKISLLTIFPQIFENFLSESLIGKAIERKLLEVNVSNIRDFSDPPHYRVDDTPYGGGAGMVMRAEPICRAVEQEKQKCSAAKVILLSASGQKFTQKHAQELSQNEELIFVCGRYEGVDQRAVELCVDMEFCIGDFVIMGGEVAAMAILEAILRLRPEVLGNEASYIEESFSKEEAGQLLLEAPQYTKPSEVRGKKVPEVLLSGDHAAISEWRHTQAKARTIKMRPDLLRTQLDKS